MNTEHCMGKGKGMHLLWFTLNETKVTDKVHNHTSMDTSMVYTTTDSDSLQYMGKYTLPVIHLEK